MANSTFRPTRFLSPSTCLEEEAINGVDRQSQQENLTFKVEEGELRCWSGGRTIPCYVIQGTLNAWQPQALQQILDMSRVTSNEPITEADTISSVEKLFVNSFSSMEISLKTLAGKTIILDVEPIFMGKDLMANQKSISQEICLFFNQKPCEDNEILFDCKEQRKDILYLTIFPNNVSEEHLFEVKPLSLQEEHNAKQIFVKLQLNNFFADGARKTCYEKATEKFKLNIFESIKNYNFMKRSIQICDIKIDILDAIQKNSQHTNLSKFFKEDVRFYLNSGQIGYFYRLEDLATNADNPLIVEVKSFSQMPRKIGWLKIFTWILFLTIIIFIIF